MLNITVDNELQNQEVVIIPIGDIAFDTELANYLKGKQEVLKPVIDVLRPFTVFVKNNSNKRIVGITLEWEITKSDGTIQILPHPSTN